MIQIGCLKEGRGDENNDTVLNHNTLPHVKASVGWNKGKTL
jgi:hypothetical protein